MRLKLGLVLGVALIGAAVMAYREFATTRTREISDAPTAPTSPSDQSTSAGLTATSSKVSVIARWHGKENNDVSSQVIVTLNIAKGWHVNANPASLDFLIPTTVTARIDHQQATVDAHYPAGRPSGVSLNGTEIKVYDSGTTIRLALPASTRHELMAARQLMLQVQAQSCSDKGVCLAPSVLHATLKI